MQSNRIKRNQTEWFSVLPKSVYRFFRALGNRPVVRPVEFKAINHGLESIWWLRGPTIIKRQKWILEKALIYFLDEPFREEQRMRKRWRAGPFKSFKRLPFSFKPAIRNFGYGKLNAVHPIDLKAFADCACNTHCVHPFKLTREMAWFSNVLHTASGRSSNGTQRWKIKPFFSVALFISVKSLIALIAQEHTQVTGQLSGRWHSVGEFT